MLFFLEVTNTQCVMAVVTTNKDMMSRMDRAMRQDIFLLRNHGGGKFHVAGMTDDYHTELAAEGHKCSCPDFERRQQNCKHIYWLLFKYFRLDRQRWLTDQHMMPDEKELENTKNKKRERDNLDDDCIICLEPLNRGSLHTCQTCYHHFHDKCLQVWLRHAPNDHCPLCRQPLKRRLQRRRV